MFRPFLSFAARRVGMDGAMVCARREASNVLQPQGGEASSGHARAQRGEQAQEDCHQGPRISRCIREAGGLAHGPFLFWFWFWFWSVLICLNKQNTFFFFFFFFFVVALVFFGYFLRRPEGKMPARYLLLGGKCLLYWCSMFYLLCFLVPTRVYAAVVPINYKRQI